MATQVRTLDFLPEVFRTDTNSQFLAATLDQLVQQPDFTRVEGFIGQKFGYAVEPTDKYVDEPTQSRYNYQLDPSVIFLKDGSQTAKDFINYTGIVSALGNQGAITNNNSRLFENKFYSWDSFADLDMIVNYSQYYWIPNGPDAVTVSTNNIYSLDNYVTVDSTNGYTINGISQKNPTLTLLRGGTYTFQVDQSSSFWIQGAPGLSGYGTNNNISTRDVLGVSNNGIDKGTVTFTVPQKDAQQQYTLPGNNLVDIVSTSQFNQINGQSTTVVTNIDGVTQLDGKTLMFYNNGDLSTQVTYYNITVVANTIVLLPASGIISNQLIISTSGTTYVARNFYRDDTGTIQLIPYISAVLDTLYYQDAANPLNVGRINLIDSNSTNTINISDILGATNYVSPNGVTFINGLKVAFESATIPESYQNNQYYVSGVGSSINLLPVDQYYSFESKGEGIYIPWDFNPWDSTVWDQSIYVPLVSDYLTINRDSRDRNAWSRGNRWFNVQVINATALYNGTATSSTANTPVRAQRPIIQFYGNLGLYNTGTQFLGFVNLFDNTTTDAFLQVAGQTSYTIDGIQLYSGQTVIFNADVNQGVRQSIFEVGFAPIGPDNIEVITLTPTPRIRWWSDEFDTVYDKSLELIAVNNNQVYISSGTKYEGTGWRFSQTFSGVDTDGSWIESQLKSSVNQAPLFDVYDINGYSLSNLAHYPGTTFTGTKLFSYTPGTGANDSVLGFPIAYASTTSIGEILFTVNLNYDTFNYQQGTTTITDNINIGFIYNYISAIESVNQTGYVDAYRPSSQYQVFQFTVAQTIQSTFICDVLVSSNGVVDTHNVYYNDSLLSDSQYSITLNEANNTTLITLITPAVVGSKVTVLLYSDQVSATAYYEIPSNLQNNPFNTNITSVNIGDLKNQYTSIFSNAFGTIGPVFGPNNIYNLGNLSRYSTEIIESSASMVLPGVFLRKPELNVFEALQYNSEQYIEYKTLLVNLTNQNDFSIYTTPSQMLDTIIYQLSTIKNSSDSFFWSDMFPSGSPYVTNKYSYSFPISTVTLPLSKVYSFTSSNYNGVLIYLTTTVNSQSITTQLISGVDYVISDISPQAVVTYNIVDGDVITVNEYNQTYGQYCPNTPTKLGLYKSYIPGIILDTTYTTPTYFILGHDGSYNALYGEYIDNHLTDFRDQVLLEFESRVYNNLKIKSVIPLQAEDVIPGQFRTTDYTWSEIIDIYQTNFLKWVGANRVDYKTQAYTKSNQFTYNYSQSTNKIDGKLLQQGYWRGLYNWFYDTSNPASAPWEMLGFANEPTWWSTRYGVTPYTSDNTLMWTEISEGFIWNNGNSYINPLYIRSGLLSVLPVDSQGKLLPPLPTVVKNYSSLSFQRNWLVGDQGPAETSYLRSSTWPFDLMRLLALTKPAKFFNLFADRDLYVFDEISGQYLYNQRYHLNSRDIEVYGNGTSKASYINWVVDYINQRGVNGANSVTSILQNIDVRLTYNLAGFSSKDYLSFLIEKSTPNSLNSTLLIPDNSYEVLVYNNVPEQQLVYSSIIIQKTSSGYTVWGNSKTNPYFTVAVPSGAGKETVTVGTTSVTVSTSFSNITAFVPYGALYFSVQGVSEFIQTYGQYLIDSGMKFEYTANSITYNWQNMIRQFINWTQQYWEIGSTVSLNPAAKLLQVISPGLAVRPLNGQTNFILNQNLLPLQNQNVSVVRENESFSVQVLSDGDTIALSNLNLASIESAVIFDNYTVFNDTIYDLITGLRQDRLLLQGFKSSNWTGYMNAPGFIISQNNIQDWEPYVKYPQGSVITFKGNYWTAIELVQPNSEFSQEQWKYVEQNQIQFGLLNNPSTNAYESLYYYDTKNPSLSNDKDLLAYSLIGYRPRQYLEDADLSLITQVNVYQNLIQKKGTNLIANSFKSANLLQGQIDYDVKENWIIKTGSFGTISNSNFVEARLNQTLLTGNPTILAFTENSVPVTGAAQNVNVSDLINWNTEPTSQYFLPELSYQYNNERGLPSAGYVNLRDITFTTFNLTDLNNNSESVNTLYRSNIIWVANYMGSWDVFTPVPIGSQITQISNNLNGTVTVTFGKYHGLSKYDPFVIFQMDPAVNGYYQVAEVVSATSVVIGLVLSSNNLLIFGPGLAFKLISRRFAQASEQVFDTIQYSEFYSKNSWIDENTDGQWAVWTAAPIYSSTQLTLPSESSAIDFGTAVAYSSNVGSAIADSSAGIIYRFYQDSNGADKVQTIVVANSAIITNMTAVGSYLFASDSLNGKVYVYELNIANQLTKIDSISIVNTGAIAVSTDVQWLYIANSTIKTIYIYSLNDSTSTYQLINTIVGPSNATGFGTSIATSIDGTKLIVGAPYQDLPTTNFTLNDSGAVYVYSKSYENFFSTGSNTYSTYYSIPGNIADVYINDVLITTGVTIYGSNVTFDTTPEYGSIVTVSYGHMTAVQTMLSARPIIGGNFGLSVATNKYGAQILIGTPFELSTANNTPNVQGAVYRWTNSGQQYGSIIGTVSSSTSGVLFLDGYIVNFNGLAADIAEQINVQTPRNIKAVAVDNTLQIGIINGTQQYINNVIDIVATESVLAQLGITVYTNTQVIVSPTLLSIGAFGTTLSMGNDNSLIVTDPIAAPLSETTFDYSAENQSISDLSNYTIFDNGSTTFVDSFGQLGVVYEFNYLPAYNESITNSGNYVFGQYIQTIDKVGISKSPNFGTSIVNNDGIIVVASSTWYENGDGLVLKFSPVTEATSWYLDKTPLTLVDVHKLNYISIYDTITNESINYLDYIDPVQGKQLAAVEINLDYIQSTDPASYVQGLIWTIKQVGSTWLDTTNLRMLNYNQPDIEYNSKIWGQAFPGSLADIYTWVQSSVPPINWISGGIVVNYNSYNTIMVMNNSSNSMVSNYFFWVKNLNEISPTKTLSPLTVSQYVLNPLNSGISYLAALTTNVVALMNTSVSVRSNSSALHIGYSTGNNSDEKHTSWTLIQENNASSFLPGLPVSINLAPTGLYSKYIDSFCGQNEFGYYIPNTKQPLLTQFGIDYYQSMYVNRLTALTNYIQYANNILIQLPIAETRNFYFLNKTGASYDTTRFWEYTDWWASGYDSSTIAVVEVEYYADLQTIAVNQLISDNATLILGLQDGLIARVTRSNSGNSQTYVYNAATGWVLIGIQNGTIQLLSTLYTDPYGWDSTSYDTAPFDATYSQETYNIIRWLNEQCYINELQIERNNSLILMFNYMTSESLEQQNYLTWLNKTSLIDVSHKVRELLPYKKYQADNQEFLAGYLNEVKPYHVKINDFLFTYPGIDVYDGFVSDFDLPAQYYSRNGQFESPILVYTSTNTLNEYLPTSDIWQQQEYTNWFSNYGLSVNNENLINNITQSSADISSSSLIIPVKNSYGFPISGTIIIGAEKISYSSVNHITSELIVINRGLDNTVATAHLANSSINASLPAIIIIDGGRGYVEPPIVNVAIDTIQYPSPRTPTVLSSVVSDGKVNSITVVDAGSGYATAPTITIAASSINAVFDDTDIDLITNTITISNHPFITGDSITYRYDSVTTVAPVGLTNNSYYYIRSIDVDTIALYYSLRGAYDLDKVLEYDTDRVELITVGSGPDNILAVTAKAIAFNGGRPVREVSTTIKFDRISYGSNVAPWGGGITYIALVSLVTYAGKLWQCINSNTSPKFNYDNWVQIYSDNRILNAADRVAAFYDPTANMSGNDIRQLMTGVEYPNSNILGPSFNYGLKTWDTTGWDANLWDQDVTFSVDSNIISPTFSYDPLTNPNVYDIQGGRFEDGYGPEELVPGLVIDDLEFNVTTDPDTLPIGQYLDFRISVNKYGAGTVYNTNPFTQTSLSHDFVSKNGLGDVLYVENASRLVSVTDQIVTTNSSGVVMIECNLSEMTAPIEIHIPNTFTYRTLFNNYVELTIDGITSPTEIVVTTTIGNMLLLNSEYIQFSLIDIVANTVTGLSRGRKNSITNSFVAIGTIVQSVLDRDKLDQQYYDQWWYDINGWDGSNWDMDLWDQYFMSQTLQESTTVPAEFLKRQSA